MGHEKTHKKCSQYILPFAKVKVQHNDMYHGINEHIENMRPSKKKPIFRVDAKLRQYLVNQGREVKLPVSYRDLLRFTFSIPLKDKFGKHTLWETVTYDMREWEFLRDTLVKTYAILKTEGDLSFTSHLDVARIDFCTFGNSHPFRIRIVNKINDNHDHYYIKQADASRIYGLELEHLLSPNRITFLTNYETLVEEHIPGIPGDVFSEDYLMNTNTNIIRFAKEFVKFNERCFVRLLGDMRSYNFVVSITPDIDDDFQYRIRCIDFDQQSFEGKKNLYRPQFFKENKAFVEAVIKYLDKDSIAQYQAEERTMMTFRLASSRYRVKELLDIMHDDDISQTEKINQLKIELADHFHELSYLRCRTMGQIVKTQLKQTLRKSLALIPKTNGKFDD